MTRPIRSLRAFARMLATASVCLAPTIALAQPGPGDYTDDTALPGGMRGERIRQVLDAVNSGDPVQLEALVKNAFGGRFREIPLEDHLGALGGLYDGSRGLDFYGVRRYVDPGPADRVVVIARNRLTGAWQGLSLSFDATPEERITGIQIQPARPPKDVAPPPPLSVEQAKLELDQFLDRLTEAFLGAKGWTKADLSTVRVEHLLSHTSGLGSYFNDTYQRMARQLLRKVDDYKPLVAEETLAFEPGTKWQYSNTGFLLAGAVIEAVTVRDYFDVVRERIYAKAGMPDSDSYDIDLVVPKLAIGYSRERTASGTRWRANTFEHVIRGGPAGGGYSTARDLLAFAEAMCRGRLVSAATAERLWSPKPELQSPEYGYGFGVGHDALGRRVGHSGGFPGISSVLDIYPDSGWTIVVLSNLDGGMQPVAQKLREVAGRIR